MFKQLLLFTAALFASAELLAVEYLVKYKSSAIGYSQVLSMHGLAVEDTNVDASLMKVNIPKTNEAEVLAQLYRQEGVEYVVPNARVYAFAAPLDPYALQEQWHIAKVRAEEAWAKAGNKGSKKVTVAVIDTGVDYTHPSLKDNMVGGYDFNSNDDDPMDVTSSQNPGHGTHCAGIIGATGVVEGGTIGISPEVSIMPIRFLNERGGGDFNNGIKAIDYAISKKVDVISASWGAAISRTQAQPLIEAIERATKAGIIFVAAAGNDGKNNDGYEVYPANANVEGFISVAASGPQDEKPQWSNYGPKMVHLASPGLNIVSTLPKGKHDKMSGTSMAAPLVSGLVAFLKAQDPSLTGSQVISILQTTGADVSIQTQCNCRIDAFAATEMVVDKKMYLVPTAGTFKSNDTVKLQSYNAVGDVQYQSSNEAVLKIATDGTMTAGQNGDAVITAVDSNGSKVSSRTFHVGATTTNPEPTPPGDCPFEDPLTCMAVCIIMPDAPWCSMQ